jgi:hypothetical protein
MPSKKEIDLNNKGLSGDYLKEPVCDFSARKGDVTYKNPNNSWIVLGRDRPSNKASGYGATLNAGAIDLVVGRNGNEQSEKLIVENNFKKDAARIYISQKTDIDENFSLVDGTIGSSKMRSGIGIKADAVRIIGREGIKLVTGLTEEETNSQGLKEVTIQGIDLIAGNKDSLPNSQIPNLLEDKYPVQVMHPLVKGYNLQYALGDLVDKLENLSGILGTFLTTQMEYNTAVGLHYHYSPFYAIPTTPSPPVAEKCVSVSMKQLKDCVLAMNTFKINLTSFKTNFLIDKSPYYINSNYNRTN